MHMENCGFRATGVFFFFDKQLEKIIKPGSHRSIRLLDYISKSKEMPNNCTVFWGKALSSIVILTEGL